MWITVLILFLTALALGALLWVGTLILQGWLYETPAGELYWRAPAVGAGLALLYGLWVLVDGMTGASGSMFGSVSTERQYDQLQAVVKRDGKDSKETYRRRSAGSFDFMLVGPDGQPSNVKLPEAPERIIIEEDGKLSLQVEKIITEEGGKATVQSGSGARDFTVPAAVPVTVDGKAAGTGDVKVGDAAAVTTDKKGGVTAVVVAASPPTTAPAGATVTVGKVTRAEAGKTSVFDPETHGEGPNKTFKREQGQSLHYYDNNGRSINEGDPGHVEAFHWDRLLWNAMFHVLHLALWFVGLWVVLRFQWPHALGLALVLWVVMTLFPLPVILDYANSALRAVGK